MRPSRFGSALFVCLVLTFSGGTLGDFAGAQSSERPRRHDVEQLEEVTVTARKEIDRSISAAPRFLTTGPFSQDYWPCFSPDGRDVLFSHTFDGGKSWGLWIVKADGGRPRILALLPVSATRASWSAKNHLIAVTGTSEGGKNSVWIIDPYGTNRFKFKQILLAGLSNQMFYPSWYPNGDQLAVSDGRDLVIKRIDLLGGGGVTTLTDHNQVLTGMSSVSPDGKWIAFAGQLNRGKRYDETKNSIWLLELSSGALRSLETPPEEGRTPSWSPDGKRLAFESNRGSVLGRYAVFVVDRDGSRLQQVTPYYLDAQHPAWSPDGRRLAFATYDGWIGIVDLPPDGQSKTAPDE
jgi:Tol biopolymer transport system component